MDCIIQIQFPIIQRQWDVINSFRPQITYRATQSLREQPSNVLSIIGESTKPSPSSPTMIAETLLSIHLLDSLPLSDTLSLFLNQRSKTLQNLYARIQATPLFSSSALKPKNTQAISKSRRKNREVTATLLRSPSATPSLDLFKLPAIKDSDAAEKARKAERNRAVRDVRQSLRQVLELIGHTVSTSRRIFGAGSSKPLLEALLGSAPSGLPSWDEFQISTSQILSSLPSSTLLQRYLPASVQSYAPYIDITSRSAHLSSDNVNSTTSTWLKTSLQSLQDHLSGWLGMLHNVKEVWSVWIGLHNWQDNKYVAATWLDAFDTVELEETMDLIKKACVHRVQEVLKDKLIEIEGAVVKEVQKCVELLREGSDESTWDANPSAFQFSPSYSSQKFDEKGLVALLGASTSIAESKQALRQRVENRTPLLHSTLTRLEQLAGELKDDLSSLEGPSGQTLADATDLSQKYRPEAETTALSVVACMKEILERENVSSASEDTNYRISLFVGRVALELATSSSFIDDLVTGSLHAFQVGMQEVHSLSLDYWKQHAVGKALASYRAFLAIQKPTLAAPFPSAPSPQLMRSLLQLVSAIHQLGMRADQTFSIRPDRSLMNAFVAGLAAEVLNHCSEELLFDLMLLRSLPGLDDEDGMKLANTVELLQERLSSQSPASYREQVVLHITHIIPTQLARIQLLFSPAFSGQDVSSLDAPRSRDRAPVQPNAPKPPAEHDMKLALNLAKPSARFGLLLVPGSGGTMR
ncbi:hypothetical protein FRC03_006730 [Tulasnella sp. 419]|nr:hypothetical protein FRC03_006730 [Tulasnella sp. 419]